MSEKEAIHNQSLDQQSTNQNNPISQYLEREDKKRTRRTGVDTLGERKSTREIKLGISLGTDYKRASPKFTTSSRMGKSSSQRVSPAGKIWGIYENP